MGVRLQRTYALRWDVGHHLAEVEIDIRSTTIATLQQLRALRLHDADDVTTLAALLAEHITRWNLDDEDGQTLPVSTESLLSLESAVLQSIGKQWYLAAAGITAPLDERSTSGDTSPEESLPMETL